MGCNWKLTSAILSILYVPATAGYAATPDTTSTVDSASDAIGEIVVTAQR
jgi:hypothetical protein